MDHLSPDFFLKDQDYFPSHALFRLISQKMKGKTFHSHAHLLYLLRSKLGPKRVRYLEVGSFFGATLCLMAAHPFPSDLYALDCDFYKDNRAKVTVENLRRFSRGMHRANLICGNSASQQIQNLIKLQVRDLDLLFLDGDRSEEGVCTDLAFYPSLLKAGGFLVIDDYGDYISCPGVARAVEKERSKLAKHFHFLPSLPNLLQAGLTKTYAYRYRKYPIFSTNPVLILQKK